MKKTIIIIQALAALVFAAGCDKLEFSLSEVKPKTITAGIEEDEVTRVTLGAADENGARQLKWESTDKIYVYAPSKEELRGGTPAVNPAFNTFNIDPASISAEKTEANFTEASAHDWSDAGSAIALVGKMDVNYSGWYTRTGGTNAFFICLNYPGGGDFDGSYQSYAAGNPEKKYLYMKSQVFTLEGANPEIPHLTFTPVVSIIMVRVKNSSDNGDILKRINLSCTGKGLRGEWSGYSVNKSSYDGFSSSWGWTYGDDTKEANRSTKLLNINREMTSTVANYYIVVPPANHGTLTVRLTDSEENYKEFTLSGSLTTTVGKITKLPVIDWSSKAIASVPAASIPNLNDHEEDSVWH